MTDLINREAVLEILRGQRDAAIETSSTYGDRDEFDEDEDEIYANALDVLIGQVERLPAIVPQVVANISGGLLQGASCDYRADIYVLDFDLDCVSEDCVGIDLDGERSYFGQQAAEVDPDFVKRVIEAPLIYLDTGQSADDGEGALDPQDCRRA